MTGPSAGVKAIDIVDEFTSTEFEEESDAAAWLVKKIPGLEEAGCGDYEAGHEA